MNDKTRRQLLPLLESFLKEGGDIVYERERASRSSLWKLYDINGFEKAAADSIYGLLVNLYFNRNKLNLNEDR